MNRQFDEMLKAAIERLRGVDPWELSRRTGLTCEASAFHGKTFGQPVTITWPDFKICAEPKLEMWHHLTLLQYLAEADGTPLSELNDLSLSEFQEGGMIRGASLERQIDDMVAGQFSALSEASIRSAAKSLDAVELASSADLCFRFAFMPNFPITVRLWLSDDEFPASCKVLFNRSAEHGLKVEAAGTLAGVLVKLWHEKAIQSH